MELNPIPKTCHLWYQTIWKWKLIRSLRKFENRPLGRIGRRWNRNTDYVHLSFHLRHKLKLGPSRGCPTTLSLLSNQFYTFPLPSFQSYPVFPCRAVVLCSNSASSCSILQGVIGVNWRQSTRSSEHMCRHHYPRLTPKEELFKGHPRFQTPCDPNWPSLKNAQSKDERTKRTPWNSKIVNERSLQVIKLNCHLVSCFVARWWQH